ncbi:sensor histidine kinase [Bartonella tamiae]|uniref:sensor histidine kinase n=1 Tax=Bartonella tamiae TaxID=373638 RepID=UPI0002E3C42F|nr:HAMP domain-containing sensor histidine kinase [Bartonella tamiae]
MVTIFIFDTVSRLEIAAAVFYIIVILIGARYFVARGIILLSVVCTVLTISSFLLTKDGAYKEGLINTIIALMALYLTSYIVIRAQMSEKRAMNATEQMTRMARIQSLGELTASIAHEINQPLAATTASADACRNWLVRDKPDIGRAVQALERISKEAHRASEVIERVRRLSKNEITKKEIVDFNEIVAETIALSKALIEHNDIELHWNRCESKLLIDADRVQIMQVIGNLFLNAIEALNIRHAADRFITVKTFILDNRANLRMTDTGIGISDDDLKHIFDAFWTKREGGTGLGLTLCRAIVEAHKGVITARTNPHGGAIFEISLPLAIKPEVILHGQ